MLEFLCPNGHQIRCPEDQAGRAAKCPRCGVHFRIPDLAAVEVFDSGPTEETPAVSASVDSPSADLAATPAEADATISPVASSAADQEPLIEFLCPNGHRLHGPSNIQGQPGECPVCEAKFRIPGQAVPEASEATPEEPRKAVAAKAPRETPKARTAESPPKAMSVESSEASITDGRSLADVFTKLWRARASETRVEIHLVDGKTLCPGYFGESLSGASHAVFAEKDADGSYTLTLVGWESVTRVVMHDVDRLPEGTWG